MLSSSFSNSRSNRTVNLKYVIIKFVFILMKVLSKYAFTEHNYMDWLLSLQIMNIYISFSCHHSIVFYYCYFCHVLLLYGFLDCILKGYITLPKVESLVLSAYTTRWADALCICFWQKRAGFNVAIWHSMKLTSLFHRYYFSYPLWSLNPAFVLDQSLFRFSPLAVLSYLILMNSFFFFFNIRELSNAWADATLSEGWFSLR